MKISYNWLKKYVNIEDTDPQEISSALTSSGLEVEGLELFESIQGGLKGIFTGKVVSCEKHPNADKLSLTKVDIGSGTLLPIVCGAPNVAAGQKVVVATVGTKLYMGDTEFEIKKAKIRGEVSEGMICAEDEIGLGTSHEGIMVLEENTPVGQKASEYFDVREDWVFEIGLTPNRTDATSHYGVARDLVATMKQQNNKSLILSKPSVENFKIDNTSLHIPVVIENPEACPRYSGITMRDVKVTDSPSWLKNLLNAVGIRPINNIVDITNFVLLETGQPLHAFDADKIKGGKVIVRKAHKDEKFVTLDGVKRNLLETDLMICDESDGMCIAGVFGGEISGVVEETGNIFIESAYFDPAHIRLTSKHHALQTDASFRFERGADPNITVYALKRAAMLIRDIAGGEISSDIVDLYPEPIKNREVSINLGNTTRIIGKKIDTGIIRDILKDLEIEIITEDNEGMKLSVPTYRCDVTSEVDVIEEILRIYGYNNVETSEKLNASISFTKKPDPEKVQNTIADMLSSEGFSEIMTNSLTKSEYSKKIKGFDPVNNVTLLNPLSSDLDVMRQSLLFGGLESVLFNQNRKSADLRLYEFGYSYIKEKPTGENSDALEKYIEKKYLVLFLTGKLNQENWNLTQQSVDIYTLKSFVNQIFSRLGIDYKELEISEDKSPYFDYSLRYTINGNRIASLGRVDQETIDFFEIRQPVFYAEISWQMLLENIPLKINFREIPRFPEVRRDLALLVDQGVRFDQIEAIIAKTDKHIIKSVGLFDVYEGEKIEKGKKSYAVKIIFQDRKKTLTDKQVDKVISLIINELAKELNAVIR